MPLYLTERDVESLFEPGDAVPIVEDSFRRLAAGDVVNQPRLRLPLDGGALALMGAVDSGLGLAGVKTYAAAFVVVLFDAQDGRCVGVIEANVLGQLRTGAASGVAAKHLAREGATRLGILGCGFQAETQVACIRAAVPTIEHVVAYCRTEANLEEFCARVGAEPAETHREACVDSDVVVAATTSKDPSCAASGCRPARSSARWARTTRAAASWTMSCSNARPSSAATRANRRVWNPET